MKAIGYLLVSECCPIDLSIIKIKPPHCTGNLIRLKRQIRTTVKDQIKKFNEILQESIVEAVITRIYFLKVSNIIHCASF